MKLVYFYLMFFVNTLFTLDLQNSSLIFIKNNSAKIIKVNNLKNQGENFHINKVTGDSVTLDQEKLQDIKVLGKKINFVLPENVKCSLLDNQENYQSSIKILDLNGEYFVFLLKDDEVDAVYLISNDLVINILGEETDTELDTISQAIEGQPIEVIKIPLPPVVTQTFVRILAFCVTSYHYIKDSISNWLNKKHEA